MLRCAITDSSRLNGDFPQRRRDLRAQVERWITTGIDFIQLREKDLEAGALLLLAEEVMSRLKAVSSPAKLMINSRADVAVAAGAHGVHLTSHPDELTPAQVRAIFSAVRGPGPFISQSCHSVEDIARAHNAGADLMLFGPVFEKHVGDRQVVEGAGLDALRAAVTAARGIPVLALGGVTEANTAACLACGARGVAGIRLFRNA